MPTDRQAMDKRARLYRYAQANWGSMTLPERYATMKRLANKPVMLKEGLPLTPQAVREGMAFMVYKIDAGANNSKFYEGIVQPADGGFRVIRRWGALTDSPGTGRVDGRKYDDDPGFWFDDLNSAKRELRGHYAKRIAHGYIDAFGPHHVSPQDGRKLPQGQYPVGLSRTPSFGWGEQSIAKCVPMLKYIVDDLNEAMQEIQQNKKSDTIEGTLSHAVDMISRLTHEDSTMAAKLKAAMAKILRRVQGSPRFLPDPDGVALMKEIRAIVTYVTKQTSYCS